ncbi:MAG: chorismate synthase [Candidatus Gastranaerophilales bacterium]|nr:chorismate synthase [Candidatus Gastranaerophilales bacterium]
MAFRFLTSGESHGKCLTAIIEGIPAGIPLKPDDIDKHLARRQQGYGRGDRMKIEQDRVLINSGVRHGMTTGAPVCFEIENKDWQNWQVTMSSQAVDINNPSISELITQKKITHVRPGHADLPGALKYNHQDIRNVLERSSARETAARVAVGALASTILGIFNIEIFSHVLRIGPVNVDSESLPVNYNIIREFAEKSELRCADYSASIAMKKAIDEAKEAGDSFGGLFEVVALGVPVGLGSYVHWDKRLDGLIAQAIMSIPGIKTVSIGLGKASSEIPGSKLHDEIYPKNDDSKDYQRKTNHSGGIEGGISNGNPIVLKGAMKPIPTLKKPLKSINLENGEEHIAHYERSDVCAVPAAGIVGESMLAIVLLQAFLEKFGGDSLEEIKVNYENYCNMYQKR